MSEQAPHQPQLPREEIERINYDIRVADQEVFLSPDEAWEVKMFIKGVPIDHPYRPLFLEIDEQYKRSYPRDDTPIHLGDKKVLALAGTYIGMFWAKDKADILERQKVQYKIDKVLGALPDEVQEALRRQMDEGDR